VSTFNAAGTVEALLKLVPAGSVVELRAPEYQDRKSNTLSGYYNDLEKLASDAAKASGQAPGIYFTTNPVQPELLSRRVNRCEPYPKLTTADHDIERRRWALIDIDPVRPTGICATDAQHDAAQAKADQIATFLTGLEYPEPVMMDSGNGAYLMYPVDLPNDATSRDLVHNWLKALAAQFNDASTEIDVSVANAARIIRIPGTLNAKGDNTVERPHRRAQLLNMPGELVTCQPCPTGIGHRHGAATAVDQRPRLHVKTCRSTELRHDSRHRKDRGMARRTPAGNPRRENVERRRLPLGTSGLPAQP
jgi:hypothetical protein